MNAFLIRNLLHLLKFLPSLILFLLNRGYNVGNPLSGMLDCDIVVDDFELQSSYNVQTNSVGKLPYPQRYGLNTTSNPRRLIYHKIKKPKQ